MTKDWDPLAPIGITAEQAQALGSIPHIADLHQRQKELMIDLRFAANEVERTQLSHTLTELKKEIKRMKLAYRREANAQVRNQYFEEMPVLELQKQIKQFKQPSSFVNVFEQMDTGADNSDLSILEYVFEERARIADAFWGPDAGTLVGEAALCQRIQVVKDLAALCHLREQRVPGKRINRYKSTSSSTAKSSSSSIEDIKHKSDSPDVPLHCSLNQCIICFNELGPLLTHEFSRVDSLRRHVQDKHAAEMDPMWKCGHPACRGIDPLGSLKTFLHHAAKVHNYDIRMQLGRRGHREFLAITGHNQKLTVSRNGAVINF